jgi:acyl dehydratase
MAVSNKHILQQGPVIRSLASTAFAALRQQLGRAPQKGEPALPGPEVHVTLPPRPADLVKDYIRHVGGDPSAYRGTVPAHMFPQWGFGLASQALAGIPYPLARVLNGGCRLQINAQLPAGEPLDVRAWLQGIDDNGRRAVLHQRVVTGTPSAPNAIEADLYAIVPLGGGKETNGKNGHGSGNGAARAARTPAKPDADKKDRARVPDDAEEIGRWRLRADAGLDFAKLTGDFNPVHWIPAYAKAFGFRNTILHGFSTMARAIEGLQRGPFAGSVRALRVFDCKFTRPVVLPCKVGLYVRGSEIFVGDAPGGPAYLVGSFETGALPS